MIKKGIRNIHPGEYLREELIAANGLSVTKVAAMLKVSRQAISNITNEKADISPEMALRIAKVFGRTPDIWLRLQAKYDLEIAAKKISRYKLMPYQPAREKIKVNLDISTWEAQIKKAIKAGRKPEKSMWD